MENYYEITKKQARDIGKVMISDYQGFDPMAGEAANGFNLVSEQYAKYIDTSKTKLKPKNQIELKTSNINTKMITNTDWKNLSQDFFYSSLMSKVLTNANPNGYSTFLKVLTDGENNYASENAFLSTFNMLGITWTPTEKAEINTILTNNNFTVQVS